MMKTHPLALRLRDGHGDSTLSPAGRKRCRSESDDALSATDSEEGSSLEEALKNDLDSDCSGNTMPLQQGLSEDFKRVIHLLVDWIFPTLSQWADSACYIHPPEYRIPPRKRSRGLNGRSRSIFIETEDSDDPSTILILRIDGYFHLACPYFVSDPSHHESCMLEHDLRSIADLIRHLGQYHPNPFYCPICGQIFDNDLARDRHIRTRSCVCREFDPARGVSRSQLRKIIEEDDRSRREDERWRRIYAHVFPRAERPRRSAAYLGQGLPLAVSMARDYWDSHGRELVEEYLAKEGLSGAEQFTGGGFWTLCELSGQGLIQRVIADARKDQPC